MAKKAKKTVGIRDRIKELRRVKASELKAHPRNWRLHGEAQSDRLSALLREIGYADALLAYEDADGRLTLFDGHLRRELTPNREVPVLVTDLTPEEAETMLATLDPIGAMAEANAESLEELLGSVSTPDPSIQSLLDELATSYDAEAPRGEVEFKRLDTRPPPALSWVLVGIPTVRFGEIASHVEAIAAVDDVILETTVTDAEDEKERGPRKGRRTRKQR